MVEKRVPQNKQEQQQLLFASQQTIYVWKNVQLIERGSVIIVMQEEVRVLGVRRDSDYLFLSYTDPISGTKTEQLFNLTDYVYLKM
ncbi:hypothetical protein [Dictyobacter kobayashii]|uniref:Uncharacterized protein n=1 Tax=Dictyobacter kobayashii TaxID=2014872 RepID=A0A402AU22_9CHLR|nr:hypothetical protein [Dictyobacter kobayashii]GCE22630.1 hypothetical protein KDK_64300 [Dictyobacter kobayashii]